MVNEFFGLGDASVFEVSLGFADEKNPLVLIGCEELLQDVNGKKGRIDSVFVCYEHIFFQDDRYKSSSN